MSHHNVITYMIYRLYQSIENLIFYLKHGMVLDKIHSVISFTQKAFAKSFIEEITNLRSSALTKFEKGLYKFINNVLFGKSMQVLLIFYKELIEILVQRNVQQIH